MHIELEEWVINELQALDKFQLVALILDLAEEYVTIEVLADYIDNWPKHS